MKNVLKLLVLVVLCINIIVLFTACEESKPIEEVKPEIVSVIEASKGNSIGFSKVKELLADIMDYNNKEYENVVVEYKNSEYTTIDQLNELMGMLDEEKEYTILSDSSDDKSITAVVTIVGDEGAGNLIDQNEIGDDIIYDEESSNNLIDQNDLSDDVYFEDESAL